MNKNELLDFSILDIIQIKRENFSFSTKNKSCYVISCRLSGESMFYFNNKTYQIKRGDVLYIPYGSSYSQKCNCEEIVYFHLNINGQASDEIRIFSPDNPDEICSLFMNAAQLWKNKPNNYIYHCMSDLYKIVALTNAATPKTTDNTCELISPSIKYLHAHVYDNTLSLDDICNESHISKTCFIKHFRDIYECTPITYINTMRINKAKMLLKTATYTRPEIASLCGFNDVKYFYILFKKTTGMTTNEYLKKFQDETYSDYL